MTTLDRVTLQKTKLEHLIDSIEAARLNEGITDKFMLWVRNELQVIDNGLSAIELVLERKDIVE